MFAHFDVVLVIPTPITQCPRTRVSRLVYKRRRRCLTVMPRHHASGSNTEVTSVSLGSGRTLAFHSFTIASLTIWGVSTT
jgi:hypothetical protein